MQRKMIRKSDGAVVYAESVDISKLTGAVGAYVERLLHNSHWAITEEYDFEYKTIKFVSDTFFKEHYRTDPVFELEDRVRYLEHQLAKLTGEAS